MSEDQANSDLGTDHAAITQALLRWYRARRRDLPWRQTRDPYRIWVSEVMLQQTQVTTVLPYYARFLEAFPTVAALAAAALDRVLVLWEGLGYYTRARNMHRAAQLIVARHEGRLPTSYQALLALPGIGAYTAGAVASIAFGADVPAVDANVVRVLCRLFDFAASPRDAAGKRALGEYARALLPAGQAGDFNQAMMELGATLCTPKAPLCGECPFADPCVALRLGVQTERPLRAPRRVVPHREWVSALIERRGRLLVARRVPEGLLGGLWELPGCESGDDHLLVLGACLASTLGLTLQEATQVALVRHAYTHFRISVHVCRAMTLGMPQPTGPWDRLHWLAPEELGQYAFTGVTNKSLANVPWPGAGLLL
jgi:A/G-specific adenine glycosylase